MNDSQWYTYVALGFALVLIVGFVAGLGLSGVGSAPTAASGSAAAPTTSVNVIVAPNPASGLDQFFPANLTIPVHALVTFTIVNYDNGTNIVPSTNSAVSGTIGGTETVVVNGVSRTITTLPADDISHTFTVSQMPKGMAARGMMDQINVMIPPASSPMNPTTVVFTLQFDAAGTLTWFCIAECDSTSMGTPGLMSGTITVG